MEFQSAQQISPDILQSTEYDLFILGSGYEQRCTYLLKNFEIKAKVKIALAFEEKAGEPGRRQNDSFLLNNGFQFIKISGENEFNLEPFIAESLNNKDKEHINILVDYSSMTKKWYAGIINCILLNKVNIDYITVHFSYTPALYNEPKKSRPIKVHNFISIPTNYNAVEEKPVALILGLGLDSARAKYIIKEVKPAKTFIIYADPAKEVKYVEKVFKNNQEIIEEADIRNIVSYPLHDMDKTDETLTNLCLSLRGKYNLIIAPLGPKVFSLLSLLLASRYPDIKVLRVSSGSNAPVYERIPVGKPFIYSVEFISDFIDF